MKTQIKTLLAFGALCAGSAAWFALSPSAPLEMTDTALEALVSTSDEPLADATGPAPSFHAAAAEEVPDSEPASIQAWQAAYAARLQHCSNPEEARAALIAELDEKYHQWIHSRLAALAKQDPQDRYEALAQMESRIQAVSESILGHLGIAGAQHLGVLARSLEAVTAETEYAEMPGTHEARVAMLRLDREREARVQQLAAAGELTADSQALNQITPWYEARLREIVGGDEPEE